MVRKELELPLAEFNGKVFIAGRYYAAGGFNGGGGDITGPDDCWDNSIPRFDGTSGKILQNTELTIDDLKVLHLRNGIDIDALSSSITRNGATIIRILGAGAPGAVNYWTWANSTTGGNLLMGAGAGVDDDVTLHFIAQGAGDFRYQNFGGTIDVNMSQLLKQGSFCFFALATEEAM